ncbi:MAG TPA: hypothetical protein VI566_00185 [Xanthomonadales bacterium]|nr:hypothetical protein [Xanthomonadales bacterium]
MRSLTIVAVIALGCASCAAPQPLAFPPLPGAPDDWHAFSTASIPGSECPLIEGVYLEPPSVHRQGAKRKYLTKNDHWLFIGPIPFFRATEEHLAAGELDVPKHGFVVRQPDASTFDFFLYNYQATAISKSHFRADEGDFECHRGYIEFPTLVSYATTEGGSTNFQVRNVLFVDETGALVIQSTRGPYRGSQSQMAREVSYEFFRYPRSDEQDK